MSKEVKVKSRFVLRRGLIKRIRDLREGEYVFLDVSEYRDGVGRREYWADWSIENSVIVDLETGDGDAYYILIRRRKGELEVTRVKVGVWEYHAEESEINDLLDIVERSPKRSNYRKV